MEGAELKRKAPEEGAAPEARKKRLGQVEGGYLNALSPVQRDAATSCERIIRVVAGPGSGKTRVLVARAARLMETGVPSRSLLLLTFTNKAANEMRSRLEKILPESCDLKKMWSGTFHCIAARILRKHMGRLGDERTSSFVIADARDSGKIVADVWMQIVKERNPNMTSNVEQNSKYIKKLTRDIALAKEKADTVHGLDGRAIVKKFLPWQEDEKDYRDFPEVYDKYSKALQKADIVDYGDLMSCVVALFQKNAEVVSSYRARFRHVLVDEMQDTNNAQYAFLRFLCCDKATVRGMDARTPHLFAVGDSNQGIYGFRGASMENMNRRMEEDFASITTLELLENYRSLEPILLTASNHIETFLPCSKYSQMVVMREGMGMSRAVQFKTVSGDDEEGEFIARKCKQMHLQLGIEYGRMAILFRNWFVSKTIEKALVDKHIACSVRSRTFYDRTEVGDVLAYLRFIVNPFDLLAFERIHNTPKRAIGKATYAALEAEAENRDLIFPAFLVEDLMDIRTEETELKLVEIPQLSLSRKCNVSSRSKGGLQSLRRTFVFLRSVAENGTVEDVIDCLMEQCGYKQYMDRDCPKKQDTDLEASESWNNVLRLKVLMRGIQSGDDRTGLSALKELMQEAALFVCEANERERGVQLMTIHAAKGLEFDAVFIAGCEEGILPMTTHNIDEEEEARLMFVAITRAKDHLILTAARARKAFKNQIRSSESSRFVGCLMPGN